jgi:DNA-binding CsgD family transcriptional regulator
MTTALEFRTTTAAEPAVALNERELTVLGILAAGYSYDETATKMRLPRGTVSSIASRIIGKLHARNLAHAVHLAHMSGMIHHPRPADGPTALDALHSIIAGGFSNRVIAFTIGVGEWKLSRILHGTAQLTPELEHRILRAFLGFYGQAPEDHGIPKKTSSRARNVAMANGWRPLDLAEVRLVTRHGWSAS